MANVPRWLLAIYIYTVSFQELGEIIQFSQLLIQNWLTLLQISLPVHDSLASLPEGRKRSKRRTSSHVLLIPGKWFAREVEALLKWGLCVQLNNASESSALLPQIIKSWLCEQMVTSTQYTLKVVLT